MHLGIKVGFSNFTRRLHGISHVEVYFDLRRLEEYGPLFHFLKQHRCKACLHISTMLDDGTIPNFAAADVRVRKESFALVERVLKTAARQDMPFVIVHPGSYRLQRVHGDRCVLASSPGDRREGFEALRDAALRLIEMGRELGVELILENLPARDYDQRVDLDPSQIHDPRFVSSQELIELGRAGARLCVDIGHAIGELGVRYNDPSACVAQLPALGRAMAPYTSYLHLSTVQPPLAGIDSHCGFLESDYQRGVIPALSQIREWLALFDHDVWVVPEPYGDDAVHIANYAVLAPIVDEFRS